MNKTITVDFFHDTVCSWCYLLSPRLKRLSEEFTIDIRHHTYTLSATKEEIISHFGSAAKAKETILSHWQQVVEHDGSLPINVEGMRQQAFDYPHGGPAALACKAAEVQAGNTAHWQYFDSVQNAHFNENRNIADFEVLCKLAGEQGLDLHRFMQDLHSPAIQELVHQDQLLAQTCGIRSVPTLLINQSWLLPGSTGLDELKALLVEAKRQYTLNDQ